MTSPFLPDGAQYAWDSTSLSWAQACLRKYRLKMIEGWRGRYLNVNLRFGQHYATALEHYHKLRAEGASHEEAELLVVHEALIDTWDRTEEKPEGFPWDSGDNVKTRETLIRTIVWYLEENAFNEAISTLILSDGSPAVEYSFKLPVDDGLVFCGHIDRVIEFSGDKYVQDQKTTKMTLGPYYFDQYKPHTQMSMYTFAGKMIYNIPVKGVMIDAAQIAVGFSRFARGFTYRTEDELSEWYDNTMFWIAQAQTAVREQHFPMNPSSCGDYGGCEFRKICSMSPASRNNFLRADFVQSTPWNPLVPR